MEIDLRHARRFILGRQGLWPGRRYIGAIGVEQAINDLEQLQLDPLNIVGRAHDLILQSRVVDYRCGILEQVAYKERKFFDWGFWLAMRPMHELPYWRRVMERASRRPRMEAFKRDHAHAIAHVRKEIRKRGPLGNRDFESLRTLQARDYRGGKDTALALYYLWIRGEIFTHHRRNFERVYDLAENIVPEKFRDRASDAESALYLLQKQIAVQGIGAFTAINWVLFREFSVAEMNGILKKLQKENLLMPVKIQGDRKPLWMLARDAENLAEIVSGGVPSNWAERTSVSGTDEVTFLSPLDQVTGRGRAKKLFGFDYIWEVYKPLEKRKWGYYVLPILWGDSLVGRIEPVQDKETGRLNIRGFWLEDPKLAKNPTFKHALQAGLSRFERFLLVKPGRISGPGASTLKKLI
jgi:uncharacterized protein